MNWKIFAVIVITGTFAYSEDVNEPARHIPWQPALMDVVAPAGLPEMGKWMLTSEKKPAQWLGQPYRGRNLREPINIIIIDDIAKSAQQARERLHSNFKEAGFSVHKGHSADYQGYIGGVLYSQIPEGTRVAFSDELAELANNHGRVFGPHLFQGPWIFIAAFSREEVDPLDKVRHRYDSFNRARDVLAHGLDFKTNYKIRAFVRLNNAMIGDSKTSTGDHDTIAVLLRTSSPSRGGG
jgi:hypothetical protein